MKKDEGGTSNMNAIEKKDANNIPRYCSVEESLKESLKEVKMHKQGKLKLNTWDEFVKSLENGK